MNFQEFSFKFVFSKRKVLWISNSRSHEWILREYRPFEWKKIYFWIFFVIFLSNRFFHMLRTFVFALFILFNFSFISGVVYGFTVQKGIITSFIWLKDFIIFLKKSEGKKFFGRKMNDFLSFRKNQVRIFECLRKTSFFQLDFASKRWLNKNFLACALEKEKMNEFKKKFDV